MRIRFSTHFLDSKRFVLERDGDRIPLRPKVFDLLIHLIRNRDRVVSREELGRELWGQTVVGTGSLSGLVNELRKALGESRGTESSIRTVHARGYQFVAPVEQERAPGEKTRPIEEPPSDTQALSTRVVERLRGRLVRFVEEELKSIVDAEGIEPLSEAQVREILGHAARVELPAIHPMRFARSGGRREREEAG